MKRIKTVKGTMVILCMALLIGGCAKTEPMPLTTENLLAYMESMNQQGQGITVKEAEGAKGDEKKQAEVFRRMLVKPMEDMGYSYDVTIRAAAIKMVEKDYPAADFEVQTSLRGFLMVPVTLKDKLVQLDIISPETKDVLEKIKM